MFLGLGGGRDRDQNFGTCWDLLEFGFKFYFITSIVLCILTYLMGGVFYYFPIIVSEVVLKFQVWRLITSFMLPGMGSFAIINVLFDFYILYMFLPDIEKKLSTAYVLLEVILQTLACNIVLVVIGFTLLYFGIGTQMSYVGYGMLPAIFVFIWSKVSVNPDQPTRFCFFPCLIPLKYIPWCFLMLFVLFGGPVVPIIIYCLLGYYQNMIRKQSIIRLPLSIYRKVDSIMPTIIKQKSGYIKVTTVEANLKNACLTNGCCNWGADEGENNPFNNERANNNNPNAGNQNPGRARVEVIGGGVSIGGSNVRPQNQVDFKHYWQDKEQQEVVQNAVNRIQNNPPANPHPQLHSDQQFARLEGNDADLNTSSKPFRKGMNDSSQIDNESILSDSPLSKEKNETINHQEK